MAIRYLAVLPNYQKSVKGKNPETNEKTKNVQLQTPQRNNINKFDEKVKIKCINLR